MALKDLKFAESEFSGQDIASLPDRPNDAGMTAAQLKARFDQIGKAMIALGRYNDLIDALTEEGAKDIGAAVEGLSGEDVQTLLEALKAYEDEHRGKRDNPHAVTKAQVGLGKVDNTADTEKPVSTAQRAAINALAGNVLQKDNATEYTPIAPYHPATKEYVDQTALEAGAVRSVFGRAGAVIAQAGDYTAAMVGARPESWMPTAAEVGAAPATHASQHAAGGSDPITPAAIGAVSKSGDTMTGNLTISKNVPIIELRDTSAGNLARMFGTNNRIYVQTATKENPENDRRQIVLANSSVATLQQAAVINDVVGGTVTSYKIYHEANKPTPADIGASVAVGKRLLAGDDLNNYRTDGLFHIYAADASSVSNVPVVKALFVISRVFDDVSTMKRTMQMAFTFNSTETHEVYYRIGSISAGWSAWSMMYGTDTITKGTTALTAGTSALANDRIYLQYS